MQNMYFVLTIVNRSDNKEFVEFFDKNQANNIYSMPAHGTASDSVLDILGIAKSEKTIHFSLLVRSKMKRILSRLTSDMLIDLPGRGIALAIPLSSIASRDALNYYYDEDEPENENKKTANESEEKKMNNTELIVVICEKGHTDLIMDAAREAGHNDLEFANVFFGSSDAAAFTQAGITATCLAAMDPGPADYYHNRRDSYDRLEPDTIEASYDIIMSSILKFADEDVKPEEK